jgi:uncharacterized protein (DUF697 family)
MSSLAEAEKQARQVVDLWSVGAIAAGWVPGSSIVLGAGDIGMVIAVGRIFGFTEINEKEAVAIFASLAGNRIGHYIADVGLSFIPGIGWAIKAGVAGGVTKAIGEGVIQYFKIRSPLS